MRKLTGNTPLILFISSLLFYSVQIPFETFNADVITFSLRALTDAPILDYAYLDVGTLLSGNSLPNYHIGHTIIQWLFYQLVPNFISSVIWPSGFLSAICAAFTILLTYLISKQIGLNEKAAIISSIIFSIIPSFWEYAIVGEIHSLQMLFILLSVYSFLKNKLVLSSFSFLMANLVTPMAGLSFGLFFLAGFSKTKFKNFIYVGGSSLLVYFLIFYLLQIDITAIFGDTLPSPQNRGVFYRILILLLFILLNVNFFIFNLPPGLKFIITMKKELFYALLLSIVPYILLVFVSAAFFIEKGSFQIPLYWSLSIIVGISISRRGYKPLILYSQIFCSLLFAFLIWILPHYTLGNSFLEAGKQLETSEFENVNVIGAWKIAIPVIYSRNGSDFDNLNNYFIDKSQPSTEELIQANNDKLIIADYNKPYFRQLLSNLGLPGLKLSKYDPISSVKIGTVRKIYNNSNVTLYYWQK